MKIKKQIIAIFLCLFITSCKSDKQSKIFSKKNLIPISSTELQDIQLFIESTPKCYKLLMQSYISIKGHSFSFLESLEKTTDDKGHSSIKSVAFLPSGITLYEFITTNNKITHLNYNSTLKKFKIKRWLPLLIKNYPLILEKQITLNSKRDLYSLKETNLILLKKKKFNFIFDFNFNFDQSIKKIVFKKKRKILEIDFKDFQKYSSCIFPKNILISIKKLDINIKWKINKFKEIKDD